MESTETNSKRISRARGNTTNRKSKRNSSNNYFIPIQQLRQENEQRESLKTDIQKYRNKIEKSALKQKLLQETRQKTIEMEKLKKAPVTIGLVRN